MSDLLLDLAEYMVTESIAQGDGIDVFRDIRPDEPDFIIVLHEYVGNSVVFYEVMSQRSVQISVRNTTAALAKTKIWEIFKTLLGNNDEESIIINGRLCSFSFRQTPFKLMVDEKNRTLYAFNVGISTELD